MNHIEHAEHVYRFSGGFGSSEDQAILIVFVAVSGLIAIIANRG